MGGAPWRRDSDSQEGMATNTTERLRRLRSLMSRYADPLDAYVIPTDDAHGSEYVASVDQRRAFISGFTGSAGTAIVTLQQAYLFTDGRYFLQAERQLDKNWTLMRRGARDVPTWQGFLAQLPPASRIGIDPALISIMDALAIRKALAPTKSLLVETQDNLVDRVWGSAQPARVSNPIVVHPRKYAGADAPTKIEELRKELTSRNCQAMVVSPLDEVAWLLNIRGSDIAYNPVTFAYVLVTASSVTLYAQDNGVTVEVRQYLAGISVLLQPYDTFMDSLRDAAASFAADRKVLMSETASLAVAQAVGLDRIEAVLSPISRSKAIKNQTELDGFRSCHLRDGAALCAYFAWLEEQLQRGARLDEAQVADRLEEYRSHVELYRGLSFDTISSTGPNAAVVHYSAQHGSCAIVDVNQIYLCDSGGQFCDGTTDVTRTLHFGTPSEDERRAFTWVLKGHIAIDTVIFPEGTTGYQLDVLARTALWQQGLDYTHGTGHGVGSFLCVHEGPQGIAARIGTNRVALEAGMILSNEPGYYADGKFGVRIESLVIVKEAKPPNNFQNKGWLSFERVTMAPIQTKLVDTSLLSLEERGWLNAYHAEVLQKIGPLLEQRRDERALNWLRRECHPV